MGLVPSHACTYRHLAEMDVIRRRQGLPLLELEDRLLQDQKLS